MIVDILWTIGLVILIIILAVILYKLFRASLRIVPEERRLVVYRLGRFNRVAGPGMVFVLPVLEQVVRMLEVRDHPLEVTVPGIFAYGVPNDLTLDLWCSFDLVRAAGGNRAKLAQLVQINEGERRKQVEVKMREALVHQVADLEKHKPLPEGSTSLDGVIALAPGTERYTLLVTGVKAELEKTLPSVGVVLNTTQPITLTGRVIPDVIIEAIKRMQGRQIDSKWLTKYANDLRQQFPDISSAVLDQMLASIDGVDVGNVQRLRLEQDEASEAHVELEVPMGEDESPTVVAKPKVRLGNSSETESRPATAREPRPKPAPAAPATSPSKSDWSVLKQVPRSNEREQRKSA
ncbi:MAG: hypothetical protein DPW09_35455 [Anaerolineae bacterium]|nr:hypothetical protein [Anaerolineales bacterium]MCQ3978750.1 hypothetical protein [Anaerolineae bacterium]